jgi:hypothetical protein
VHAWDRFWFAPASPATLGLMRLFVGGMVLYTHVVWGLELDAFFGPAGWQDPELVRTLQRDGWALSFWWLVPPAWNAAVHGACLAVLGLFLVGLGTRIVGVLAFLIVVSYAHRVPAANFGLDQINAFLTLYLALSPCGGALSIDRLLQARAARRSGRPDQHPLVTQQRFMSARLATRLMQVHLCVLYLFAGISKLKGDAWWDGEALWLAAANLEYQSGDLTWLAWRPWLYQLLTHVTVLWESTFWILVWRPAFRPWVLLAGLGVHLGIGAFMGMWTFGLIMMIAYLAFLPSRWVHRACGASADDDPDVLLDERPAAARLRGRP